MQIERIRSWARQMASSVGIVNNIDSSLDELKASLDAAISTENDRQQAAIQTELDRLGRDRARIVEGILSRCNTTDFPSVTTRLVDIDERLELADVSFRKWRKLLAHHEFAINTGAFSETEGEGVTRAQFEGKIEQAKHEYDMALSAADALIPNKATIILA